MSGRKNLLVHGIAMLRNSCLITLLKKTKAATGGADAFTGGVL